MKKLTALVATLAFSFGIGLAVPATYAQTPAPKEDKKSETTTDKKAEKKSAKKKTDKKAKAEKTEKKDDKK
jgi:hypothetical protein